MKSEISKRETKGSKGQNKVKRGLKRRVDLLKRAGKKEVKK